MHICHLLSGKECENSKCAVFAVADLECFKAYVQPIIDFRSAAQLLVMESTP